MAMFNLNSSKRGQAAMEFLMTYGWAILVVLVVIGALAYFGVLNPQQFLPTKCQLPVGLSCSDYVLSITPANNQLYLTNGLGTDIEIDYVNVSSDTGIISCRWGHTGDVGATVFTAGNLNRILAAGDSIRITTDSTCGATWVTTPADSICCFIRPGIGTGIRIKGPLTVTYTNLRTNIQQTLTGTIITDLT
jgi:hypothetical protein